MSSALAKVLAEGVHERGAGIVFGMPGGGPNLDVVGAAGDAGLRFVLAHDEASACMMAGTFGLLTNRPALAIATRGPGAANAVNGAAQATLDRFPLLLVTDCVGTSDRACFGPLGVDGHHLALPAARIPHVADEIAGFGRPIGTGHEHELAAVSSASAISASTSGRCLPR